MSDMIMVCPVIKMDHSGLVCGCGISEKNSIFFYENDATGHYIYAVLGVCFGSSVGVSLCIQTHKSFSSLTHCVFGFLL